MRAWKTGVITTLIAILCATPALAATAATPPDPAVLDAGVATAISADVAASVLLPSGPYAGDALWVFGDTTVVNGQSTVGSFGYPHGAFAVQVPGNASWAVLPGPYGPNYGGGPWQQVPNWSDGGFFWAEDAIVDNGSVFLLGNKITIVAGTFVVGFPYVAKFSMSLAYLSVTLVAGPAGEVWGGAAKNSAGNWEISGTRPNTGCVFATDCKIGDMAVVPTGSVTVKSKWAVSSNVFPAADNTGTIISLDNTGSGWAAFSKEGDGYGSNSIERLSATAPGGPWTVTGYYPAPSQIQSGQITYGAQVHPEQPADPGQVLISVAENDTSSPGGVYEPQLDYLPLTG